MTTDQVIKILKPMLLGQPIPYSWAKQNYNSGWDQAIHHVAKQLIGLHFTDKSPLKDTN